MRGTEFLDKMELINPTYVEVADVKPKKKSTWIKLGTVAACLCLIAVGALSIVNSHMKQYIVSNNIFIAPVDESSDSVSYVTPEQAECLETANTIHNKLSAQNYEWYGSCYYDFENEKIMIGLTELTDGNKEQVSAYTGNTAIEFYKCDYSYVYLEELYNKIDKRITVLSMLGVDRYNISVRENRVKVHIKNDKMYDAIYAVSKIDSSGGAILFTSNVITADGRSG